MEYLIVWLLNSINSERYRIAQSYGYLTISSYNYMLIGIHILSYISVLDTLNELLPRR